MIYEIRSDSWNTLGYLGIHGPIKPRGGCRHGNLGRLEFAGLISPQMIAYTAGLMPIEFKQATLTNGLQVIAEVDGSAHSTALGFFVKTGARDEHRNVMGVSHFLEHMMFKGTAARSAEEVDQEFDNIGAEHNAFTTCEMTAFHVHILPDHLNRAEEILADLMRPALRDADFENEKKVILEEIAMYDDYPFWVLYERAMEAYYRDHPLAHRVLGTTDTITRLTRDQMMEYFTNRYAADNTVVAAAGKLEFDALVERLSQHCGNWNTSRPSRLHRQPHITPDRFTMTSESVHRHYMLMVSPGPSQQDERRYAAAILSSILGAPGGSRLFWALIETGLAEEAQVQHDPRDGIGDYMIYASCSQENAGQVEQIIRHEVDHLVESLKHDDLERVRSKIATSITLHGELPAGRMKRLGRLWTYVGEYRSLESELARLNAVTLKELRQAWEAFPITPLVVGHLTPVQ
jgi:predicted Zn-dependent peptidase